MRVGGDHEPAPPQAEQIIFTHQPLDAFVVQQLQGKPQLPAKFGYKWSGEYEFEQTTD
jgi:hypothetical protein